MAALCETAARDDRSAPVASLGYTPRQAERTVLHQVVRENLETFLATTARADPAGLPAFLEQEFRGFLDCGVWARGFARFQCFDLHADRAVRADDRAGLERLARDLLRPPLAQERLSRLPDGRVVCTLRHPWHDGTHHLIFTPHEFLERLAAITPRPRINMLLYHGSPGPAGSVAPARIV